MKSISLGRQNYFDWEAASYGIGLRNVRQRDFQPLGRAGKSGQRGPLRHPDVVVVLVTNSDDYEELTIQPGPCQPMKPVIQVK